MSLPFLRHLVTRHLAALLLLASALPGTAATLVWNTGPGAWSSAANWTPNQVPGPGDIATVPNGGVVKLDTDVSVQTLNLSGGGLTGEAVFQGVLNWSGGSGTLDTVKLTIAHGSQLNLVGAADKLLVVGVITNHGIVSWTGSGSFKFGFDQAYLRNEADGEFQIRSTGFLGGNPVSDNDGAYIYNSGLITCDVGPGTTTVAVGRGTFVNRALLRVLSGTLSFSDGLISQDPGNELFVADGATLRVASNGPRFADTVFSGPGLHLVTNGDVTMIGGIRATNLVINSATVRGSQSTGGQTLLSGRLEWQAGNLTDLSLTVVPGAELALTGASLKFGGNAVITNHGRIAWTGTGHFKGSMQIVNATDGEFLVQSTGYLGAAPEGENFFDRFENHGLWICDVGAGKQSYESAGHYPFVNTGRIEVRSGSLLIDAPIDSSGSGNELWVAADATLELPGSNPDTFTDTVFSGPGLHHFYRIPPYGTGPVTWNGNITCTNVVVDGSALRAVPGGTLHGTLDWRSGETSDLNLTVAPDGILNLVGAGEWNLNRGSITNHGLINWPGLGNFRLNGAANFVNETDGVFVVRSTGFLGGNPATDNNDAFIVNRGTWISDTGPGTNTVALAYRPFINTGTLEIRSGTLLVAANAAAGGTFDLPAGSTLRIGINGSIPNAQFGRLQVVGKLSLAGEFQAALPNGYQPQATDNFNLLSAGSISGAFSSFSGVAAGDGLFLDPVYANGGVTLRVRDDHPELQAFHVRVDQGAYSFTLNGAISQSYDLYYSNDLVTWAFLRKVTLATPSVTLTDATVGSRPARFYLARLANPN